MIEREKKRARLVNRYAAKRAELKEIAKNESLPMEERFKARLKLASYQETQQLIVCTTVVN